MRIISNNKTENSSDYLERKNIVNYNNVITEEANI